MKNKVQLMGNLGTDPEIRITEQGRKLVRFSLATHEPYKNGKGEWVRQTQWHNIIAWGKQAEHVALLFEKGSEVLLEGKLLHRVYTDRSGVKRVITEIELSGITPVARKKLPAGEP